MWRIASCGLKSETCHTGHYCTPIPQVRESATVNAAWWRPLLPWLGMRETKEVMVEDGHVVAFALETRFGKHTL